MSVTSVTLRRKEEQMNQEYEKEIQEYKAKLEKLSKSNELPEEQLRTIYKNAYLKLRQEIKDQTARIIKIFAFGYCKQSERDMINRFLKEDHNARFILEHSLTGLLRIPDYDVVIDVALELKRLYECFKYKQEGRIDASKKL